jgi:GNAT superfamily N-acetyltransferase
MIDAMQLRQVRLGDPEVSPLLKGLTEEYESRYGEVDEMMSVDAKEFEPPDGVFLVLVEGGVTVAGGGLRRLTGDSCEVKRMWTAPDQRRKGLASIVLDALEAAAKDRGYSQLLLETGPAQPEAHSLYERRGYTVIPPYGIYEQATAFERHLDSHGTA